MKVTYFLPVVLIFFVSCNAPRYMYSPSAQNVPVLVKKGDSKVSASYSNNLLNDPFEGSNTTTDREKGSGFDIQGAVAVTDHFAIQANYFNRTERNSGPTNTTGGKIDINYKRKLTEIGIGYFQSMHRKDKVMFQVFGGVGKGLFSFTDKSSDPNNIFFIKHHQADVFKIYVQPAILFRIRDNFSMSVSTRFSIIRYSDIKTDYTLVELETYSLKDLDFGSHAFWEPAFTNTFGFNKLPGVKFEYQLGTSLRISERFIDHHSLNFSFGILLDIPKLFQPATAD